MTKTKDNVTKLKDAKSKKKLKKHEERARRHEERARRHEERAQQQGMSIFDNIKLQHRYRRFAIKVQQKLDRSLESFVRINLTDWKPDADEKTRDEANKEVKRIIDAARKGIGDELLVHMVETVAEARKPFDDIRHSREAEMERLAKTLPVAPWIKSIRGAGILGLATIVAEAGDLSNYVNPISGKPAPAKLWKRLGFAPYDGFAGSSWKRESWRPRALTKDEWIANPFSGERYALIHQIAIWLVNAEWVGADKSEDGEGKPNGPYGQIYAARRAHTAETHPDWTKQHARMDGVRIAMKAFLKDLIVEWHALAEQREAAE